MATFNTTGTITVTNGSAAVTGAGTNWLAAGIASGTLYVAGAAYPISEIHSNTSLTLEIAFAGTGGGGKTYAIAVEQSVLEQTASNANRLAQLLQDLSPISSYTTFSTGLMAGINQAAWRSGLGLGTMATQANTGVNIDGGAIDGTPIGAAVPASGKFTSITMDVDNPVILLDKANGGGAQIQGVVGGLSRWGMLLGNGAMETGANAGSDFTIYRSADGGAYIDTPFKIVRSTGAIEILKVDINSGTIDGAVVGGAVAAAGTFTTLKANSYVKTASYTVATVPSAAAAGSGGVVHVSNEAGGAVLAFSDGTNWRRVTDRAIIS